MSIECKRPAIQADGDDIEYVSFDNDHARVRLKGRCQGCSFAMQIWAACCRAGSTGRLVVPYGD